MTVSRRIMMIFVLLFSALYIILTLGLFASPTRLLFNKDGDLENWASLIIGSGIAVYIAISLFVYSYYEERRRKESMEKRKKFAMEMIGKNLIGQSSLLTGLQRWTGKDRKGTNMITGKKIDYGEFNEKGIQLNNSELKSLLNISFDVVESDLLEKLIGISEQFEFRERFKEERMGNDEWFFLEKIKNILEKYFPHLLSEFNTHVTSGRKMPV